MTSPSTRPRPAESSDRLRLAFAAGAGLLLGLSILKFGNPVILDRRIPPPNDLLELWLYPWPLHWAFRLLLPLGIAALALALTQRAQRMPAIALAALPLAWLGWQVVAGIGTLDASLTGITLLQWMACVGFYFAGACLIFPRRAWHALMIGVLAGFGFCLVKAAHQRLVEFPQERKALIEGQQGGWTNFTPALMAELRADGTIVTTNGAEIVNPVILAKYNKARVHGTLMYPNTLAGIVLLLGPAAWVLAWESTRRFRPATRAAAIAMTAALLGLVLVWTGSKLGWLVAVLLLSLAALRFPWPRRAKWALVAAVLLAGGGVFAVRFHHYFATGATSASARLDYWRAAATITRQHPWQGTGPGTFQLPYAAMKSPESEMARLVHNDYLEQFCDSGVPGGLLYLAWILAALAWAGRRAWGSPDRERAAVFLGVLGWFLQGLGEFSLYIPAMAWTAFLLLGWLLSENSGNRNGQEPAGRSDSRGF
ncbi:MAG: O-antigen ligase family protein [Verrucomicrobiota bacterium]